VPDTGNLRSDLIAAMLQAASAVEGVSPQTLWALMSDSVNDAELSEAVRRDYGDTETSSWMGTIVGRAVTRGEITVASMTVRQRALAMQLMRDQVVTAGQITATDITEMVDEILLPMLHSG
jgi:Asp-tRNA(Asn)/Glu-tRNA(Gln) amidotransferase B subunit